MNSNEIEEAIEKGRAAQRQKDLATAKSEYQKAVDLGSIRALCNLGNIYLIEKNIDMAFETFQKAVDLGEPRGYTEMGSYYHGLYMDYEVDGDSDKAQESLKQAISYYEKAYEGKDPNATYNLALSYEYGQGVTRDKDKAKSLYNELIEGEDNTYKAIAYLRLSQEYVNRDNTFIDEEKCLDLIYKAAELSSVSAYERLGELTAKKGDVALANAYYKKAAEMYREGNMESLAVKVESKLVPCETEVEPYIKRTLNLGAINDKKTEVQVSNKSADTKKAATEDKQEQISTTSGAASDEHEKENVLKMLEACEKNKIHIGTYLKENPGKTGNGYNVILLNYPHEGAAKLVAIMDLHFSMGYNALTMDEAKKIANNMPFVLFSDLSVEDAIKKYIKLTKSYWEAAIIRDNIAFELGNVGLIEDVDYKNDRNTDDVVELLKSLAPRSEKEIADERNRHIIGDMNRDAKMIKMGIREERKAQKVMDKLDIERKDAIQAIVDWNKAIFKIRTIDGSNYDANKLRAVAEFLGCKLVEAKRASENGSRELEINDAERYIEANRTLAYKKIVIDAYVDGEEILDGHKVALAFGIFVGKELSPEEKAKEQRRLYRQQYVAFTDKNVGLEFLCNKHNGKSGISSKIKKGMFGGGSVSKTATTIYGHSGYGIVEVERGKTLATNHMFQTCAEEIGIYFFKDIKINDAKMLNEVFKDTEYEFLVKDLRVSGSVDRYLFTFKDIESFLKFYCYTKKENILCRILSGGLDGKEILMNHFPDML